MRRLGPWWCAAVLVIAAGCRPGGTDGNVSGPPAGSGVIDTFPANGATHISPEAPVLIEFAAPMNISTVAATITPSIGTLQATVEGQFLELSHGLNWFTPDTRYSVALTGKTQAGAQVSYTFTFGTRGTDDTVPPTYTVTPANGDTVTDPQTHLVFHFSESMLPHNTTVKLDQGVLGAETWNDTFDTLDIAPPPQGFIPGSTNRVTVYGTDRAWNEVKTTHFGFSVAEAAVPLEVLGMSPQPGRTDVPTRAAISLSFSRDMEPTSTAAAISVTPGSGCYAGSYGTGWINPRMYRCYPSLSAGTQSTVTVGTGATDAKGNAMTAPFTASFTAANSTDSTAPTIVSVTPAAGALLDDGQPLVIQFSEPMDRGSAESEFRWLGDSYPGHFSWNADSTQLSFAATEAFYGGPDAFTIQSAEDLNGNGLTGNDNGTQIEMVKVAQNDDFPGSNGWVTVGSLGSRTAKTFTIRVGDDARDEASAGFFSFDLNGVNAPGYPVTAIRHATLLLEVFGCEGDLTGIGSNLLVEGIDRGDSFDAADLTATATSPAIQVPNACANDELFLDVTDKVRADLAAATTAGALSHFRVRFPKGTDGDHSPDRIVLSAGARLRLTYEYR